MVRRRSTKGLVVFRFINSDADDSLRLLNEECISNICSAKYSCREITKRERIKKLVTYKVKNLLPGINKIIASLLKINGKNKTAKKYIKKDYSDLSILSNFICISLKRVKWIWQAIIYSCVLPDKVEFENVSQNRIVKHLLCYKKSRLYKSLRHEKHLNLLSILNYECSRGPP